MKLASIREFRSHLSGYGHTKELVVVTNHGKMIGCFLPLEKVEEIPLELKKEFVAQLGRKIAHSLALNKITEEHILDDFKEFKKNRR